jgi:anti-anti-sigma factor
MTVATVDASTDNGSVHISLSGEIDLANASTVDEQIHAAVSGQPTAVSVDLTNLTYMDSVGINCFSIWSPFYRSQTFHLRSSHLLGRRPAA